MNPNGLTDEQIEQRINELADELDELREERNKRAQIGWRVICPGDTLKYGGYIDYTFERYGKLMARQMAENFSAKEDGRYIEPMYPCNTPCGRIH